MITYVLESRRLLEVNNDPLRRCYDGCHFSTKKFWGPWQPLCQVQEDRIEETLRYWRELNDFAVRERGPGNTKCGYRVVETTDATGV